MLPGELAEAPGVWTRLWGATWRILLFGVLFLGLLVMLSVAGVLLARSPETLRALGPHGELWVSVVLSLVAALATSWAVLALVERRPFGALGFALGAGAVRQSVGGTALGAALLGLAVLPVVLTGEAHWVPDAGTAGGYAATLASTLVFFALAAAVEEVLFRGYPFQVLVNGIGPWGATLLSSALFAAVHGSNPNVTAAGLANIFVAGVLLAVAYLRTRSLWFATAVHLGWNWAMATLLDFPVSGLLWDTPLYDVVETGPDWWTGGPFGPEAGVPATAALLAGTAWLLRTRRIGEPEEIRARRPLVDVPFGENP